MSQENAPPAAGLTPIQEDDLVWLRERYRLWNDRGMDAMIREVWDPDITFHDPPDFPDATTKRGAAAVAEHLNTRLEAIPGATFHVESGWWVRAGEVALTELSVRIGGRASGVRLDAPLFQVLRLGQGRRMVELREYTRMDQALEALGLSE